MENNVFKKRMVFFEAGDKNAPGESWTMGDRYFEAMRRGAFRELTAPELERFLRDAAAHQSEDGMIRLFTDEAMPMDARCGIWYQPSYAVAAVGIYTRLHYPEVFDEKLDTFLKSLLGIVYKNGIVGHGYDRAETVDGVMLGLGKAGCRQFFEQYPDYSQTLCDGVKPYVEEIEKIASDNERLYSGGGFTQEIVNTKMKHILAVWNGLENVVFVYGNEMSGGKDNARLQERALCAGTYRLRNMALYDLGGEPGMKHVKGETTLGELWFTDDALLAELDAEKTANDRFRRVEMVADNACGHILTQAYVFTGDVEGKEPLTDPWNASDDDYVWYAAYGSNLSGRRFSYYLLGGTCEENGKTYKGCRTRTLWREAENCTAEGQVYFANESASWNGKGVAFLDPDGSDMMHMRGYKITRGQLKDVWQQEGNVPGWYDWLVCLGVAKDGCPLYTITSRDDRPLNEPDEAYVNLIREALINDCGIKDKLADRYLKKILKLSTEKK